VGVAVVIILADLDEGYAGLNELPGEEAAPTKGRVAVAVAGLGPILADVERRPRPQQPPGPLLAHAMRLERIGLVLLGEAVLHEPEQVGTALLGIGRGVGSGEGRHPAGTVEGERSILRTEETGTRVADRPHAHEAG